jgi:hypothetical protein
MRKVAPEADISIEIVNEVPEFQADASSPVVPLALNADSWRGLQCRGGISNPR